MEKKKLCFICSAGGHLDEIRQLKTVIDSYDHFFVVPETGATKKLNEKKYLVSDYNRKNKLTKLFSAVKMFGQQIVIYVREKPDVVITTGAAVAIPMCIFAHAAKKKVIYLESYARISSSSKTGRLIYKWADLFIVQSEELLKFYPDAVYGGSIY